MVGLGGLLADDHGNERRRPGYFQVLARYRAGDDVHFGIGGGLIAWEEDGRIGFGIHLLGAEALVSRRLTDRLSIRFGASAVVPILGEPDRSAGVVAGISRHGQEAIGDGELHEQGAALGASFHGKAGGLPLPASGRGRDSEVAPHRLR